jgi:hypothetical protein
VELLLLGASGDGKLKTIFGFRLFSCSHVLYVFWRSVHTHRHTKPARDAWGVASAVPHLGFIFLWHKTSLISMVVLKWLFGAYQALFTRSFWRPCLGAMNQLASLQTGRRTVEMNKQHDRSYSATSSINNEMKIKYHLCYTKL